MSYLAPGDPCEALGLLTEDPEGTVLLGGGTVAVPALRRGPTRPRRVVDLRRTGLDRIAVRDDVVEVGATTSYSDILAAHELEEAAPLLRAMARGITGGTSIRNQGTVGGSGCQRAPGSDAPAVLVALDAVLVVRTSDGVGEVPATEFLDPGFGTNRGPHVLESMRFAIAGSREFGYSKLKFAQGTWPIITAAVWVEREYDQVDAGAVVLGGVSRTPVSVALTDGAGPAAVRDVLYSCAERVRAALAGEVWEDEFAPAEYRREVAPRVASSCLEQLLGSYDAGPGR